MVVGYLLKLAQSFNSYYNENQIIGSKNEEVSLALTFMVKSTLANGLEVLGITPVSKM
jgi:arginyl-tRNA synthetase